jgi:hypothetical protein
MLAAEGAFIALIFYIVMPRKFQIYQDRLTIVLGAPFSLSIPLVKIKAVKRISGTRTYVFSGIKFVTSTRYLIEISRSDGPGYLISPRNGEFFQQQLQAAVASAPPAQNGIFPH